MRMRTARRRTAVLALLAAVFSLAVAGLAAQSPEATPTATEILDRARGAWQGNSFHAVVRLEVTLAGQTKVHVLEVWTLGSDYALLRVLEPKDDAGSGYLQIGDKLWYYSPLAGGSIELPSMAIGDTLFGSGPSIEDLALGTLSEDYDVTAEAIEGGHLLTLVPHPDAPVVYGKLELTVTSDYAIERIVTYDQRGGVLRTATFSEVVEVDGQKLPTRIAVEDASGNRTIQRIANAEYNLNLDPSFFTLERLEGAE